MKKIEFKKCKHHGITEYSKNSEGYFKCKKCASESVIRRRKKLKTQAVQYKGGKCEKCGYDKYQEVLEFHHLDPQKKEFSIGHNGSCLSWEKIKLELDKCIIVCANCHREIHVELRKDDVA